VRGGGVPNKKARRWVGERGTSFSEALGLTTLLTTTTATSTAPSTVMSFVADLVME
jgi:hypothetical protein